MARTISDEELQLKRRARRRLIGAIVLVTAIVVALPMVLDSEPRPARQEISVQIPSPDSGVFTSKVAPQLPDAKGAPKPPVEEKKIVSPPAPPPPSAPPTSHPGRLFSVLSGCSAAKLASWFLHSPGGRSSAP